MRLQFLLPSRERPNKFFATLDNLAAMCMTEDWKVTAILDRDDMTMHTAAVLEKIVTYPRLEAWYTDTTGKVNAINTGLLWMPDDWEVLILIADDIVFTMKGFDCYIEEDMQKNFPDFDGLLHYPDDIPQAGKRQITMPVMGRKLVEKFGYIYNPCYVSLWCDNEMLVVVKNIKKYFYVDRQIYSHAHPAWGKSQVDDLYRKNESFSQRDSDVYFKRLATNFDL